MFKLNFTIAVEMHMIMEYPVCVHVIDFHLRCQQNAQG
ncbi:hypothetical protein T03_8580 [Trichinella britovi]|uniref:Uncharacterized protein n=1 Tax=Trichinella britovi TaxID=45882 RepID=A0A0V1CGL6_TRIBR|nr:hypothetical protein T03_8580 [Trichinella britovi]